MATTHIMNQQSKLDIVDSKYQNTIIYGIQCMTTGEMYVGSTHDTLDTRIARHIRDRNCRAIQILDRGNYKAYEIQKWPCNTLREKLNLEGGWQRAYKASFGDFLVNRNIEGTFYRDNPEAKRMYNEQYYQVHKQELNARNKQYCAEHKEERKAYNKQYSKQHYEKNKEKYNAKNKKQWTCEWCNKKMRHDGQYKHRKICTLKPNVHEAQKGC